MPIPPIDTGKSIAIKVKASTVITLRDSAGTDIANIFVSDKYPRPTCLIIQVPEFINVRRETKEKPHEED